MSVLIVAELYYIGNVTDRNSISVHCADPLYQEHTLGIYTCTLVVLNKLNDMLYMYTGHTEQTYMYFAHLHNIYNSMCMHVYNTWLLMRSTKQRLS